MKIATVLILALVGIQAHAVGKWSHESEVGIVTIDGNSESSTTSAKQMTKYAREKDSATVTAAYTEAESKNATSGQTETSAKSSNAGIRYDRIIDKRLSGFVGHGVFSNKFAGTTQEVRTDLGVGYQISKRDDQTWDAELGYQSAEFDYVGTEEESVSALRLFTKYTKQINEAVSAGASVEYRDAFADAKDTDIPLYWVNSEVNLAVVMSTNLSLKLGYANNYQNYKEKAPAQERVDTKFTTALVAKF